jgi:hypothetical protein
LQQLPSPRTTLVTMRMSLRLALNAVRTAATPGGPADTDPAGPDLTAGPDADPGTGWPGQLTAVSAAAHITTAAARGTSTRRPAHRGRRLTGTRRSVSLAAAATLATAASRTRSSTGSTSPS